MEQARINANVNSLSQKLLEGCKLLSESCPDTNVPLVLTPDGRMYSVGNGVYYAREGGEMIKVPDVPVAAPTKPPSTPSSPNRGFLGYAPGSALGTVEMPSAAPEQSLSSRVAAKLLEGFTLLSESCPVTSVPLVQDPSGRILSVGTGRWYERTGGELLETSVPGPPLAVMPTAFTNGGTPAVPTPALPTPPPAMIAPRQLPPVPVYTPAMPPTTPQPAAYPPYAAAPAAPASMEYGSGASAAVASAVLQSSSSPATAAAYSGVAPSASLKVTSAEAVAVLSARLQEAVGALSDSPIRDAGMYVVMVKDIALAIAALKAL